MARSPRSGRKSRSGARKDTKIAKKKTEAAKGRPRRFKIPDPYAEREAKKYERPIPSREAILMLLQEKGVPLSFEEIAAELGVSDPVDLEALERRLKAMERDGQLLRNRRDRYCLVNESDLIRGRVIGHPDGFGFLKPDEGGEDLFLSPREMRQVFHGDRVVACVTGIDRRGRKEGSIVGILERAHERVVGRLFVERGMAYVVPDNKRITHDVLIPEDYLNGAKPGQIVVAEIVEQPTRRNQPIGRIVEVLGEHMAPGMEIEVAIRAFDIPHEWPEEVLAEAARFGTEVPEAAKEGRVDLRKLPLVTIDGEDARDFDDAVYCRPTPKGWRLIVAIADVSHYVRPGSALDQEALKRGNSVYFPQQVIPMLPEVLSNGLCSLVPDEDRLCMVCEMLVDREGRVTRSRFYEGVMRSHARLTYTEVAAMLVDKDPAVRARHEKLLPHLEELYAVYQALRRQREARGAMDFDTDEYKIVFGEGRKIERLEKVVRTDAHKLIEECMIAANAATARFLDRKKVPYLRRIHDGPDPEKVADVRQFLAELGLKLPGGDTPSPADYMQVLKAAEGRPDYHLVQTLLLRTLPQAIYSPEKKGHFGLALDAYTHYTSPIRRYPDLLVHRAIRHALAGGKAKDFLYSEPELKTIGEHCSMTERRADEATWDVIAWLKCEYMQDKVGEVFSGVITAVTSFGFFVELQDIYVEGLVHISTLGQDFYHFDPLRHCLVGERTHITYRIGDVVKVKVARVDLDERKIDLVLIEPLAPAKPQPKKAASRRRRRKRKNAA
ncbi:ribonuclease R [Methylomarinovum caldicuralii]|uniref:Ribonuclease R n=1 Tax=Methylomarinovum caldicuralii TaxID=438856 RepID=A0AAU9CMN8_9GAMM|nr:ribonuclease R [Methylomarinovum caldicuralii]BCX82936.1 ribonuclease R [Methylomarinovum caldicuralii]